jgi:hypothetical protein
MSNTTTAAKSTPKQFTFGTTENLKNTLSEFRQEFTRPGSTKSVPTVAMSEKECMEILFKVASDRRFKVVPVMEKLEIDGEQIEVETYDELGSPIVETLDLFAIEWETIKARDYADENTAKTPLDKDLALTRKLCKMLDSSEAELEDALAKVRAKHSALASVQ